MGMNKMMESVMASLRRLILLDPTCTQVPGESEDNPLEVCAVPGLMTLLDVAMYDSVEGELTATITSAHKLLLAWLDLKHQSIAVLNELEPDLGRKESSSSSSSSSAVGGRRGQIESFARACLEAACDATDRISTDRLASSANLSDPFESLLNASSSTTSQHVSLPGVTAQTIPQSLEESQSTIDTSRRYCPQAQRARDCWETPRLHCPDYVWADDVSQHCQRLLRHLYRHSFASDYEFSLGSSTSSTSSSSASSAATADHSSSKQSFEVERQVHILWHLIQTDISTRLMQFRASIEADSCVLKRLYLVKCEYRAPFRGFLEAHQSVLKAPSVELLEEYILAKTKNVKRRESAKDRLSSLLENKTMVEALALEKACFELELELARQLFPFCELARCLDHKRAKLKLVPNILETVEDVGDLQETLRRLKGLLSRKAGPDTTTGIRPLLLDIQGVPRDEELVHTMFTTTTTTTSTADEEGMLIRLENLVDELDTLAQLVQARHTFHVEKKGEVDLPSTIVRGCSQFDGELFSCQFQDWYARVERQHEILESRDLDLEKFSEQLRRAEMQMSLSVAPAASLEVVRERVELMAMDREKRFKVLKEMVEEVCLREMNLYVRLQAPDKLRPLLLQPTSALGVFGLPLQMAGEVLPIG